MRKRITENFSERLCRRPPAVGSLHHGARAVLAQADVLAATDGNCTKGSAVQPEKAEDAHWVMVSRRPASPKGSIP
jgi:hypothetical protein